MGVSQEFGDACSDPTVRAEGGLVGGRVEVNPSSNRAVFPHCTLAAATIAPKWIFRPGATSLARSLEFYVFGIN